MIASVESSGLRFDMFTGEERFLAPNAVLVSGQQDAFLVDCGFVKSDVEQLLKHVRESRRRVRAIFITHAHPDHYGGVNAFAAAFPEATLLARQGVIDGMLEWPAKRLHWQDMFGNELPIDLVYPRPLFGKAAYLEDREMIFLDLPVAETVHATAFYMPSARALIAGTLGRDRGSQSQRHIEGHSLVGNSGSVHLASGEQGAMFVACARQGCHIPYVNGACSSECTCKAELDESAVVGVDASAL